MYCDKFRKNESFYLIIEKIDKDIYNIVECVHSFDTAVRYIRLYGNSKYLILKFKLKEVIH